MKKIAFLFNLAFAFFIFTQCQQTQNKAVANDEGATQFSHYCARCHLGNGTGGPTPIPGVNAPDIRQFTKSQTELEEIIKNGFGKMPGFGDSTSKENIAMIASYVSTNIEKTTEANK